MALIGTSNDMLLSSPNFLAPAAQPSLSSRPARAGRRAASDSAENTSLSNAPATHAHERESKAPPDNGGIHSNRVAAAVCARTETSAEGTTCTGSSTEDKSSSSYQGFSYEPTNFGRRKRGAGGGFLILSSAANNHDQSAAEVRKSSDGSSVPVLLKQPAAAVLGSVPAATCATNHTTVSWEEKQKQGQHPQQEEDKVPAARQQQHHDQDASGGAHQGGGSAGFRFKFGARLV
jgi:hypothetical protein